MYPDHFGPASAGRVAQRNAEQRVQISPKRFVPKTFDDVLHELRAHGCERDLLGRPLGYSKFSKKAPIRDPIY